MIEIEKVDRHPRRKPGSLKISENSWYLACEPFEILKSRAGRILKKHGGVAVSRVPFLSNSTPKIQCVADAARSVARPLDGSKETHTTHTATPRKKEGKSARGLLAF